MPRTLLMLTHEYPPKRGGIATYVESTAEAARAAAWAVRVVGPHYVEARRDPGLTIEPTTARGTQGWLDRRRLWKWIQSADVNWADTVLWIPEPAPLRLWMSRGNELPSPARLVLTLHGSEILQLRDDRRFVDLLGRAGTIGVVSKAVGALLPAHAGPAPVVVPGAAGTSFQPSPFPRSPRDPLEVLCVGRIHPRKGQHRLCEALARLPEALRARVRLRLIGPIVRPAYARQIEATARALGVQLEPWEVAPDAAALRAAYQRADVFALASETHAQSFEGFGIVFLEAAACALPVVTWQRGGMGEAVGPDNGLVVAGGDLDALATVLTRVLTDDALRARLSAAGPAWAARFSWANNVRRLFGEPSA